MMCNILQATIFRQQATDARVLTMATFIVLVLVLNSNGGGTMLSTIGHVKEANK